MGLCPHTKQRSGCITAYVTKLFTAFTVYTINKFYVYTICEWFAQVHALNSQEMILMHKSAMLWPVGASAEVLHVTL